jgi:ubiquinone biosynthesis protein UbiJ
MSKLAIQSELDKLGATLELEPDAIEFLREIPAEQLRSLRVAIYELLFQQDREVVERLTAIARWLPARVAQTLAQRTGPLMTARVAAEMPSRRAAEVIRRTSTDYLADVAVHLDPRRTRDLIRTLSVEQVVAVALELVRRGDFMTISRFVDFFGDDAVQAVVDAIEDEGALLRIAFYMGSKNRVDHLFRRLPTERRQALILQMEKEAGDLLPAFLSLLIHVSYALKRELGDLAAAQEESVLEGYVRAAHQQGLWPDMLPVVSAMSGPARERVVNLPVLGEADVQESILRAADEHQLWGLVLPLIEMMDDANREAVARIMAEKPRDTLERAVDAALMGEHWELLLDLVRRMPRSRQDDFAGIVQTLGEVDPDLLRRIGRQAQECGLGERFGLAPAGPVA